TSSFEHAKEDQTNGASTVFIGPSKDPKKPAQSFTPDEHNDHPNASGLNYVAPNGNAYDVAYVMPASDWDTDMMATNVCHEAGHPFGLLHVRTDGEPDPTSLGMNPVDPSQTDVMSYDNDKNAFINQSIPMTNYNWDPDSSSAKLQGDF